MSATTLHRLQAGDPITADDRTALIALCEAAQDWMSLRYAKAGTHRGEGLRAHNGYFRAIGQLDRACQNVAPIDADVDACEPEQVVLL